MARRRPGISGQKLTDHVTKERAAIRIFLAGGTGVIGSRLIPELVAAGHEFVATTRHPERLGYLRQQGARGAVADAYDAAGWLPRHLTRRDGSPGSRRGLRWG